VKRGRKEGLTTKSFDRLRTRNMKGHEREGKIISTKEHESAQS
jgi:hypothetical protein